MSGLHSANARLARAASAIASTRRARRDLRRGADAPRARAERRDDHVQRARSHPSAAESTRAATESSGKSIAPRLRSFSNALRRPGTTGTATRTTISPGSITVFLMPSAV